MARATLATRAMEEERWPAALPRAVAVVTGDPVAENRLVLGALVVRAVELGAEVKDDAKVELAVLELSVLDGRAVEEAVSLVSVADSLTDSLVISVAVVLALELELASVEEVVSEAEAEAEALDR